MRQEREARPGHVAREPWGPTICSSRCAEKLLGDKLSRKVTRTEPFLITPVLLGPGKRL